MSAHAYEPCICRHWKHSHAFCEIDLGGHQEMQSVCSVKGCDCQGFHKWEVIFIDPYGTEHTVSNIQGFVRRDHPELFEGDDAVVKFCPQGGDYTTADRALMKLADRQLENWKGWEIVRYPKTFRPGAKI